MCSFNKKFNFSNVVEIPMRNAFLQSQLLHFVEQDVKLVFGREISKSAIAERFSLFNLRGVQSFIIVVYKLRKNKVSSYSGPLEIMLHILWTSSMYFLKSGYEKSRHSPRSVASSLSYT